MSRVFILLCDSFGIGALPDAEKFDNLGANTLRHIAEYCMNGEADQEGIRQGPLKLPNMTRLGLNAAASDCNGEPIPGLTPVDSIEAAYGYAAELSHGKDTLSGHWEIAGVPALFDWGYFPETEPTFPKELTDEFIKLTNIPGVLGNRHASGTQIIQELGDEHLRTGKPIIYTSTDSNMQIAVHEEIFSLERLYEMCEIARKLVDKYTVGRVIARPFVGQSGEYYRTNNRHDYSIPPPDETLLDKIVQSGGTVVGVGKIPDIFCNHGISKKVPAFGNMALFDATLEEAKQAKDHTLIFTNFIDFDMKYGHRRDVIGYANALEEFDARLPSFEKILQPGDIAIITADHGCDPTYEGTNHTREYIPILMFGPGVQSCFIGRRETYADIGQTIAEHFGLLPLKYGQSFLKQAFPN